MCNGLPAGGAGEDRLEKYIADNLLPWAAADFAPEEAGVVDEDTYVQQGRDLERAYSLQVINYILGTLQPNTDLAMVGYPFTDEVSHQFMGLVIADRRRRRPEPVLRRRRRSSTTSTCTVAERPNRVAIREGYIRSAYADADEKLGITRELMGGDPTTFAGSDHGFAPQWYAVNANDGPERRRRSAASRCTRAARAPRTAARSAERRSLRPTAPVATDDITKACWAGGTIQIYINPNRLKNAAQPTSASSRRTRRSARRSGTRSRA